MTEQDHNATCNTKIYYILVKYIKIWFCWSQTLKATFPLWKENQLFEL